MRSSIKKIFAFQIRNDVVDKAHGGNELNITFLWEQLELTSCVFSGGVESALEQKVCTQEQTEEGQIE
jgi:hypothetical protein